MLDHIQKALVCGAGGFIGSHLVKRLKREGFWVRGRGYQISRIRTDACRRIHKRRLAEVRRSAAERSRGSMTSTNSLPTWAEPDTCSPETTMRRLCTDPR